MCQSRHLFKMREYNAKTRTPSLHFHSLSCNVEQAKALRFHLAHGMCATAGVVDKSAGHKQRTLLIAAPQRRCASGPAGRQSPIPPQLDGLFPQCAEDSVF
jgi:hypothetical protein